jgi:hypothetical protein
VPSLSARLVDPGVRRPAAEHDGYAGAARSVEEPAIERQPVDDDRLRLPRRVLDGRAGRGEQSERVQRVENDVARQPEFVEGLGCEYARAVDGIAAAGVLLIERHIEAVGGEQAGGLEPAGAAADDDDVSHAEGPRHGRAGCH